MSFSARNKQGELVPITFLPPTPDMKLSAYSCHVAARPVVRATRIFGGSRRQAIGLSRAFLRMLLEDKGFSLVNSRGKPVPWAKLHPAAQNT